MPSLVEAYSPQVMNKPKRGRPFGARNAAGESIRWGIVEAYRQLGGVDGLVKWGRKNPDMFYPMLKSLLPSELAESGAGQSIRVLVYAPNSTDKPLEVGQAIGHIVGDTLQPIDSIDGSTPK